MTTTVAFERAVEAVEGYRKDIEDGHAGTSHPAGVVVVELEVTKE